MSTDSENTSFETCNDDSFYDAVEILNPGSFVPSMRQSLKSPSKQLELNEAPSALNETYTISSEHSSSLCNQLPFLDDAIKSIKFHTKEDGIEFAAMSLAKTPINRSYSQSYTRKNNDLSIKNKEILKISVDSSNIRFTDIQRNKDRSNFKPINVDGDYGIHNSEVTETMSGPNVDIMACNRDGDSEKGKVTLKIKNV